MLRILTRRIPLLLFLGVVCSCEKPNQPDPKPEDKPAISIPTQSQAVFSNGISFTPPPPQQANQPQTQTVSFIAAESWSAAVADTKASTWLTVHPSSGSAGAVDMTVTAQPNDTDQTRKATVSIKCGTMNKSFTVEQSAKTADPVTVEDISLNKTTLELEEGESEILVATVIPENATDKTISWSSSDSAIASVDNEGKVMAVKEGAATITAKAGGKTATCSVSVSKKVLAVTEVSLSKTELTLTEGEEETLSATVTPDDATDITVTWSSSDTTVASVDDNGKVTAVKEGEATITAKAGEKTATCVVSVSKKVIAVTAVMLSKTDLALTEGEEETLSATVSPDDATDKSVTWSSSNVAIASVDGNGKVTAVKEGEATITAKAGDKTATCSVIVSKKVIAVTEISLNKTELTLRIKESEKLVATVKPDNATEKDITWSSSDERIAEVDTSGTVTAIKGGFAIIIAQAGGLETRCNVYVLVEPGEIEGIGYIQY